MRTLFPFLVLLCMNLLPACGQKTYDEKLASLYKNTVPTISCDALKEKQSEVVILDTRAPEEYRVSHLQGARLVDYDNFEISQVSNIDKNQEVIVYCSVGYRSERIGEQLQKAGFTNVKNLYGGIFSWKNEGNEVVNPQNTPTDSVHTYDKNWGKWLQNGIKIY